MSRISQFACLAIVAWIGLQPAIAQETTDSAPGFERPKYSVVLRQNENWKGLAGQDTATTGDMFDKLKYVPFNDDGSIWASFGGQVRLRVEGWNNFGFSSDNDDTFLLTRIRAHADLHIGEQFRVFVEGKSALATTRDLPGGRRGLDSDELDLQQAFADVVLPLNDDVKLTLRGGRQMLSFGKQRLVSPLDWSNTMRTWDGAMGTLEISDWKINGFWTMYVPVDKYEFNTNNRDEEFYGIYATGKCPVTSANLDLYWLGRDQRFKKEELHTVGGRISGKIGETAFDYDFEGAYQFGDAAGNADVSAWMIGSQLGYSFDCKAKPRLWLGFDYGSGDDDPASGDKKTFTQLYPLGHAYLGYIDVVGRQNIMDVNMGLSIKPCDKLSVSLAGHLFWRAEEADALYNAGGGVVRAGASGTDKEVGQEIDLVVKYKFNRHTLFMVGYSHFFAGDFIDETGPSEDIDFVYASMQFTF